MNTISPATRRLLVSVLVGPIAIVPACIVLDMAATQFHFPLVPLLGGYVFGEGSFMSSLGFAFAALVIVFSPAAFLLGLPAALLLHRIDKPDIAGLIGAPILLAAVLGITKEHPNVKIVLAYCAIAVSAGCWWFYRIYR